MIPTTVAGASSRSSVRPTMRGSEPNRRRQRASLRSTAAGPPGRSSSAVKPRPMAGTTPSTAGASAVMYPVRSRSGAPLPVRLTDPSAKAATRANDRVRSRSSQYSGTLSSACGSWVRCPQIIARRSGRSYGSARRSTPFTTLKMAVLAPMPRASVINATAVNPGRWRRPRSA